MDSTEFFGPDPGPSLEDDKDGYGRYLLDADGKGKKPYTRATTIAKMLDSGAGLEVWKQRKAAKGVAQSPALVARAAVTPLDDKQAWREILDQAEVKSGGDEKRDLGSAFHALHEHVETMSADEWLAVPDDLRATYTKYRAELDRLGIVEVMTEVTVVNTLIGTAGKADAVFRLADGRLVIGDRKSGRITEYPHSAAVQLAIYANATVLITWDENGAMERHPMPELDLTTAIVIDVKIGDDDTASVHAYEIDIWAGWAAALESAKIRRWRNRRDLITPYHPEFPPADRARNAATVDVSKFTPEELATFKLMPGTRTLADQQPYETAPPVHDVPRATPEQRAAFAAELPAPATKLPTEVAHGPAANPMSPTANAVLGTQGAAAIQHPAWSSKDQAVIHLDGKGERIGDDPVPGPMDQSVAGGPGGVQTVAERDVDALLATFKTKAQLQAVLAKVDPTANLARTRANLAKDAVSHPSWPSVRADFLTDPVARVQEASDEAAATYPADQPQDIMANEGLELRFSPTVSNAPGPVPPDPEPSYPAPATDNPFTQPPAPVAMLSIEDQCLQAIGEAKTIDVLAKIWQTANDAGIGWPPRLHKAASIRQDQLTK